MTNMTIGTMLSRLEVFGNDERVMLSDGRFLDGDFGSYRGCYDHMRLGFFHVDRGFGTVGTVKSLLNTALKKGLMDGYKGGEYRITTDTPVWVADGYGDYSCDMITEINKVDDTIVISVINQNHQ